MIIDRIAEKTAFVEVDNGKILEIPKELLPENAKEGDVIKILIDRDETDVKKAEIKEKMNRIFKD